MSDITYTFQSYCALCDLYFPNHRSRASHIDQCSKHPQCGLCARRFLNNNTLRNHYVYAPHHYYCVACRMAFDSAAALKIHIEYAPIHCDDSEDEDDGVFDMEDMSEGWEDRIGPMKYPDEVAEIVEDDGDNSWEQYDDCDFEDEEDLGDLEPLSDSESDDEHESDSESEDSDDEDDEDTGIAQFSCPLCKVTPKVLCSTPCGHLFCAPCISHAYSQTESCPVCHEAGQPKQLRKIFLSN